MDKNKHIVLLVQKYNTKGAYYLTEWLCFLNIGLNLTVFYASNTENILWQYKIFCYDLKHLLDFYINCVLFS